MKTQTAVWALAVILLAAASGFAGEESTEKQAGKDPDLNALAGTAHQAMQKGLAFLRATQGKDGAWGSHDPQVVDMGELGFGRYNFGCHDGVRIACTAICAKALLLYDHRSEDDTEALEKAVRCLLRDWKLAYDPGNAFNVWGYAFNLDFLTCLYGHPFGAPFKKRIDEVLPKVIDNACKMQVADGGWAYYTSVMMEGNSLSFTTASMILGLLRAEALGFEVPDGVIADAVKVLKLQILPNKNIIYGSYLRLAGDHHLEDLSAGGRTQICGLALHLYDNTYTLDDLLDRNNDYFGTVDYIEVTGNKRIIPHKDAPQNISGYFLYYGCYYAAEVMRHLGPRIPAQHWDHLLAIVFRNQEENGSWFDTIMFDYGDKYGTGFSLLCLAYFLQTHQLMDHGLPGKPAQDKTR